MTDIDDYTFAFEKASTVKHDILEIIKTIEDNEKPDINLIKTDLSSASNSLNEIVKTIGKSFIRLFKRKICQLL